MRKTFNTLKLLCVFMAFAGFAHAGTMVLKNGTIHTMDPDNPTATAIVATDGVITYIGDDAGSDKFAKGAEVIDLKGSTVLPGFVDGHIHASAERVAKEYKVYLADKEPNAKVYQEEIKKYLKAHPDAKIVLGVGFQINAFENNMPDKKFLDEISTTIPIIISDSSYHSIWVNSKALEMAKIDAKTAVPAGGQLPKGQDGAPVGFLVDTAMDMVADVEKIWSITEEEFMRAFRLFQQDANAIGITSVNSMSIIGSPIPPEEVWKTLSNMEKKGDLTLRVNMAYTLEPKTDLPSAIKALNEGKGKYSSDFVFVTTAKMFLDGVIEGGTGYLIEPYAPEAGYDKDFRSAPLWETGLLNKTISALNEAGFGAHMHAIGDGAVRQGLDAVEFARKKTVSPSVRNAMTHITIIDSQDIPRMAKLEVIAAMQPIWFFKDPVFSELERQMLGNERFARMYRIKDMLDAGTIMTGSADNPVTPDYRPLYGIETAVTQASPYTGDGPETIRNAAQTATVDQMLRAYTINPAYQGKMDKVTGSLKTGKKADMVVLDKDPYKVEKQAISDIEILYTILQGKVVFKK